MVPGELTFVVLESREMEFTAVQARTILNLSESQFQDSVRKGNLTGARIVEKVLSHLLQSRRAIDLGNIENFDKKHVKAKVVRVLSGKATTVNLLKNAQCK